MKIVVIGGTGLIGSKTVERLRKRGHDVIAASPNSGINTITGEGLAEALSGAEVVLDLANSPSFEDKAVLEFFETSAAIFSPPKNSPASGTISPSPSSAPSVCRKAAISAASSLRKS